MRKLTNRIPVPICLSIIIPNRKRVSFTIILCFILENSPYTIILKSTIGIIVKYDICKIRQSVYLFVYCIVSSMEKV